MIVMSDKDIRNIVNLLIQRTEQEIIFWKRGSFDYLIEQGVEIEAYVTDVDVEPISSQELKVYVCLPNPEGGVVNPAVVVEGEELMYMRDNIKLYRELLNVIKQQLKQNRKNAIERSLSK